MSGSKGSTKAKGKGEDKVKTSKGVTQVNEDSEDAIDFAVLRKPIPTSITGLAQARKIFDLATEELKDLLSNECDLLYECKVCRNIFRSLANFISHKRVYCKEKFNSNLHGHFVTNTCTSEEISQIKRTETEYQQSLKPKTITDIKEEEDSEGRVQLSKDLTAVYEQIMKSKGVVGKKDDAQVVLKKIPSSNVAVFQNLDNNEKQNDNMRSEVQEIDTLLSRDLAILGSDGKFIIESSNEPIKLADLENIIQISDDEESEDVGTLKCKICDLQFSTQKTLKFHMKYKHLESRLVYPCPDCLEIFSTSWSVYRHLFKVHRKTAAQIRRLRESIQAKAFRMNNPPAFYEKRKNIKPVDIKKITEEERIDQETQAWMDNLEGDGEVPRCGGCGRTFERRAALAAHTHTCQSRCRALARRADRADRPDNKKIEIQIRKDYDKTPFGLTILKPARMTDVKPPDEELKLNANEMDSEQNSDKPEVPDNEDNKDDDDPPMDIEEDDEKSNSSESPEKLNENKQPDLLKPLMKLPFSLQAEKSNLAALKQRIQNDIDGQKLICKKCNLKQTNVFQLYEHMADHFNWVRYKCKLCNYKHYSFDKLPEHVKVVHKLKGDSDFYYSTVKAIDGTEAMLISKCSETESTEETMELTETSPESRRPSRCSSDSSRLSDDSSSSNTHLLKDTGRKRRMHLSKGNAKKKRETNDDGEDQKDGESIVDKAMKAIILGETNSSNDKTFDENSSDMDDVEEKVKRRHSDGKFPTVASRRPVRKRTRVHNEDFEYDLSNLLKKEAQGYRDSQTVVTPKANQTTTTPKSNQTSTTPKVSQTNTTSKPYQAKKKSLNETNTFENLNKDCSGALLLLSKKAVDVSAAHLRSSNFAIYSIREVPRPPSMFARPMLPRIISRPDKASPKKDTMEEPKSNNKIPRTESSVSETNTDTAPVTEKSRSSITVTEKSYNVLLKSSSIRLLKDVENSDSIPEETDQKHTQDINDTNQIKPIEQNGSEEVTKTKNSAPPSVVPIKFRSQSLDLMKNPIINKNITDFSKAGMKTKILVIKPINRNNDKSRSINAPLKFQTIKLKDSKGSAGEDKQSDQVMVVQVPKVPRTINESVTAVAKTSTDRISEDNKSDTNETVKTIAERPELEEVKLDEEQLSILNNVEKLTDNIDEAVEPNEYSEVGNPNETTEAAIVNAST